MLSFEPCPSTEAEKTSMPHVLYLLAVGSLMFAMVSTRSYIVQATMSVVSQFMVNPGKESWNTMSRYSFIQGALQRLLFVIDQHIYKVKIL